MNNITDSLSAFYHEKRDLQRCMVSQQFIISYYCIHIIAKYATDLSGRATFKFHIYLDVFCIRRPTKMTEKNCTPKQLTPPRNVDFTKALNIPSNGGFTLRMHCILHFTTRVKIKNHAYIWALFLYMPTSFREILLSIIINLADCDCCFEANQPCSSSNTLSAGAPVK